MIPGPREHDILALGEAMVEFNQTGGSASPEFIRGYGGDTSNMAIAAARLSRHLRPVFRVGYITRVGDDAFGRALLALWGEESIDTSAVDVDGGAPTGVYFVTHGTHGHEFSYLRAGSAASRTSPETLPRERIARTRLLHVSGISQAISVSACDAVFEAIAVARKSGALVSYDPNWRVKLWPIARARAVVRETMRSCSVFLPNIEEARLLSGLDAPQAILDWAHAHGAGIVALKCGGEGVWVSDGRTQRQVPGRAVNAVDATGAGDCFDGAYCVRLLAGDDPFVAARYANAAAALATTGFGAVAPLPDDAAVRALLDT